MDQGAKDKLLKMEQAVKAMYMDGHLEAALYYKCLVALAYNYAVELDLTGALTLLMKCSHDYFAKVQGQQMGQDPQFYAVSVSLATLLVQLGVVDHGPKIVMTARPGQGNN